MRYKTIDNVNLRSAPSTTGGIIYQIPVGTLVDGIDSPTVGWKAVTLADGRAGFCSATYLQLMPDAPNAPNTGGAWSLPVPKPRFILSQTYLNEDWKLYPKFGHHTGVDYGGAGQKGLPLFACADGEIIYKDIASSSWGGQIGNHAALYVPSVDASFLYCHMAAEPHALGAVKSGDQIGVMGNTGKSAAGAVHLHLEGFHGRFAIAARSFTSLDDIKKKTFDADAFIRAHLA